MYSFFFVYLQQAETQTGTQTPFLYFEANYLLNESMTSHISNFNNHSSQDTNQGVLTDSPLVNNQEFEQGIPEGDKNKLSKSEDINHFENNKPSFPEQNASVDLAGFRIRRIMRWVGYGLFILYWVDVAYILYPPEFTNIVWEYQTMGDMVRLVPTLLLSLVLIFYGETADRRKIERRVLQVLSWFILMIAVIYFLMVPLTAVNTARISKQNNEQISTQVNQQKLQLEATQEQLEQSSSAQLETLVPVPDEAGDLPDAPTTPEEAREQILKRLGDARRAADDQAAQARENLRDNLVKNTFKIIVEAAVGAFALVYIWALTKWARKLKFYGRNTEAINVAQQDERKQKSSKTGIPFPGKRRKKRRSA